MGLYKKLFLQVGVMWPFRSRMPFTDKEETSRKPPWKLSPSLPVTIHMCLP